MYLLLRATPLLSSLLLFFYLWTLVQQPTWLRTYLEQIQVIDIARSILIVDGFLLLCLLFIGAGVKLKHRLRFYPFLFFLWTSGLLIVTFSDNYMVLYPTIFLLPIASWIWLESLFVYWQRSFAYQAYTLERIGGYLYLFAVFLLFTSFSGLYTLLQVPFWILSIAMIFALFLIQYDLFSLHKIDRNQAIIYAVLGTILGFQLSVVMYLLPTHFFMYGLMAMLFYYSWNSIIINTLKRQDQKLRWYSYTTTSVVGAILTLFTTLFLR